MKIFIVHENEKNHVSFLALFCKWALRFEFNQIFPGFLDLTIRLAWNSSFFLFQVVVSIFINPTHKTCSGCDGRTVVGYTAYVAPHNQFWLASPSQNQEHVASCETCHVYSFVVHFYHKTTKAMGEIVTVTVVSVARLLLRKTLL